MIGREEEIKYLGIKPESLSRIKSSLKEKM